MKKRVDARGLSCPLPVIEAKRALKEMTRGELEVVVDNSIAFQNLEKMAKQMGLSYELATENEAKQLITIKVGASSQEVVSPASRGPLVWPNQKIVVLSSDEMGQGDTQLGKALMKSFVYALTELEELPAKILLYNAGVKLAVQGSDSLADLKKLQEQGVEILSCGTCLDFFQLTAELGVGSITNMYEIVQSQMEAKSIIRP